MSKETEGMGYRVYKPRITKADKIAAAMTKIKALNESTRPAKKLEHGIVVVKGLLK